MKNKVTLLFLVFFTILFSTAQDACSAYYPMKEGAIFSYNYYNGKNKLEGSSTNTIASVSNSNGATAAVMNVAYKGTKKNENATFDYKITCEGDGISIDFNSLMPAELKSQFQEMGGDMEITGTNIELPNKLSVGQNLEDANVNMTMKMSGINMKTEVTTTNRIVTAKESVTTPAGTFNCYLITSIITSKAMMSKQTLSDKLWLAEGVGMVKQETYNKKGKLMSKMELSSFEN